MEDVHIFPSKTIKHFACNLIFMKKKESISPFRTNISYCPRYMKKIQYCITTDFL